MIFDRFAASHPWVVTAALILYAAFIFINAVRDE